MSEITREFFTVIPIGTLFRWVDDSWCEARQTRPVWFDSTYIKTSDEGYKELGKHTENYCETPYHSMLPHWTAPVTIGDGSERLAYEVLAATIARRDMRKWAQYYAGLVKSSFASEAPGCLQIAIEYRNRALRLSINIIPALQEAA